MLKPDEHVLRSLANLERDSNFDVVKRWIEDSYVSQSLSNNKSVGDATARNQGRNLELEEIITTIKNARTYLENYKLNAGRK